MRLDDLGDVYWPMLELREQAPRPRSEVVVMGWRERTPPSGPWARHVARHLAGASRVLDVGAGDRAWQGLLERLGVTASYESCDPERRHAHEHDDFLAISGRYDAVLMLDLLEHLPLEQGLRFIAHAAEVVEPGGVLVVSTPNPAHPTSLQATDVTHVRAWPAHDLYGLLTLAGFEVEVHRLLHCAAARRGLVPAQKALARILGVDPADHLLVFART